MTDGISLWSALVVRGVLENVLIPAFREQSGVEVEAAFDPTTVLMRRIAQGEHPGVIISTTESLDHLPAGVISRESIVPLVRTGIGVGVAKAAAKPAIETVEELVATLRSARSVAYSRTGQSGIYFASLLETLGIADDINARATILEKGFTGVAVTDGRADIAIQQVSELLYVDGIEVVGPLPAAVQRYTDFSVAIGEEFHRYAPAQSFVELLTSERAQAAYRSVGLTLPTPPRGERS
jgi:molybdate transport system substrate-binding protein